MEIVWLWSAYEKNQKRTENNFVKIAKLVKETKIPTKYVRHYCLQYLDYRNLEMFHNLWLIQRKKTSVKYYISFGFVFTKSQVCVVAEVFCSKGRPLQVILCKLIDVIICFKNSVPISTSAFRSSKRTRKIRNSNPFLFWNQDKCYPKKSQTLHIPSYKSEIRNWGISEEDEHSSGL